jgi:hypothetical protein
MQQAASLQTFFFVVGALLLDYKTHLSGIIACRALPFLPRNGAHCSQTKNFDPISIT